MDRGAPNKLRANIATSARIPQKRLLRPDLLRLTALRAAASQRRSPILGSSIRKLSTTWLVAPRTRDAMRTKAFDALDACRARR
jgi:hypothetical protein